MDPTRFDTLTRSLTDARSRRRALTALLAGPLSLLSVASMDAKKGKGRSNSEGKNVHGEGKKKKKKKKKATVPTTHTPDPSAPPADPGTGSPPPPSCPNGQRLCRGTCLSILICCDNSDCAGGRTCQSGTCACPASAPKVCPGSTICQQCCADDDCTSPPGQVGTGIATCSAAGVCVCERTDTRYCPATKWCGTCCSNAECQYGAICKTNFTEATTCQCASTTSTCRGAGRTGCAPNGACAAACGIACNPQNGDAACPCPASLICDFDPANQGAGYRCAPR